MGAVPKSKISNSRRKRKRAHQAIHLKALVECSQCKVKVLPHHVCMACGYYRGVQVIEV